MSRTPFGADKILKILVQLAGEGFYVEKPVDALVARASLSRVTVQNYLKELQASGYVKFIYGDHGSIKRLSIEKREMPFSLASPAPVPPKPKTPPPAPTVPRPAPAPAPIAQTADYLIAALVDYDNVIGRARDSEFSISFSKLKELIRGFGKVLFADAFVSPTNTRAEIIGKLWEAGFQVIACPQGSKDKDSVDAKMNWRARQYIAETPIKELIIVSRDRDFQDLADFAADLHKKVRFVDVSFEKGKLEGHDFVPQISESRYLEKFSKAIESLESGWSGLNSDEEQRVNFLKDIIRAVQEKERLKAHPMAFKSLMGFVWNKVFNRWGKVFNQPDLKTAMTAMVNKNILLQNNGNNYTHYTLSKAHPATVRTFSSGARVS